MNFKRGSPLVHRDRAFSAKSTLREIHELSRARSCSGGEIKTALFFFFTVVAGDKMTMDGSKSEPGKNGATQQECAGCGKAITER